MREADRYPHESLASRLTSAAASLRAHPRATAGLLLVAAVGLGMLILSPRDLRMADLRIGDCLFVGTAAAQPGGDGVVGTAGEVTDVLLAAGAEQADCGMSHGHEVAGVVPLAADPGAPWPGQAVLLGEATPVCSGSVTTYLGLAAGTLSGTYQTTVVVPDQPSWSGGLRTAVCLVSRMDGHFFSGRARG